MAMNMKSRTVGNSDSKKIRRLSPMLITMKMQTKINLIRANNLVKND